MKRGAHLVRAPLQPGDRPLDQEESYGSAPSRRCTCGHAARVHVHRGTYPNDRQWCRTCNDGHVYYPADEARRDRQGDTEEGEARSDEAPTLLAIAQSVPPPRKRAIITEEIELTLAWLKDEITLFQLCAAIGKRGQGSNSYVLIALACREAYRQGKLKETL
jgi:hypothetical protein